MCLFAFGKLFCDLFTYFGNGFQKLDQLQTQFIHLESTLHQHSTHLGQLTKGYAELQQRTKELLERMPILEKQNGTKTDKNWTARIYGIKCWCAILTPPPPPPPGRLGSVVFVWTFTCDSDVL